MKALSLVALLFGVFPFSSSAAPRARQIDGSYVDTVARACSYSYVDDTAVVTLDRASLFESPINVGLDYPLPGYCFFRLKCDLNLSDTGNLVTWWGSNPEAANSCDSQALNYTVTFGLGTTGAAERIDTRETRELGQLCNGTLPTHWSDLSLSFVNMPASQNCDELLPALNQNAEQLCQQKINNANFALNGEVRCATARPIAEVVIDTQIENGQIDGAYVDTVGQACSYSYVDDTAVVTLDRASLFESPINVGLDYPLPGYCFFRLKCDLNLSDTGNLLNWWESNPQAANSCNSQTLNYTVTFGLGTTGAAERIDTRQTTEVTQLCNGTLPTHWSDLSLSFVNMPASQNCDELLPALNQNAEQLCQQKINNANFALNSEVRCATAP